MASFVVLFFTLACAGTGSDAASTPTIPAGGSVAEVAPGIAPAMADADDGLVDAAAWVNGGRELDLEGMPDANHAHALFDRVPDSDWRCTIDGERCDVIIEFNEPFDLEKLVYKQAADVQFAIRELGIDVGTSASGPWTEIAKIQAAQTADRQAFPISAKGARFVRVRPIAAFVQENGFYGYDDLELRGQRSEKRAYDWNGTWTQQSNNFVGMKQTGERVVGCFADQDRFEGTVDGPVFTGIFHDIDGETVTDWRLVLVMTPDGALHGVHSDDMTAGSPLTNRWDAVTNTDGAVVSCDPPPEEQPDEIEQALAKEGRIALYGVLFDFDKDTLKPESDKVLAALAATIQAKADRTYRIEGHTDDKGGEAYNQDLSARRAAAVKAWLVKNGCAAEKLETSGFGASMPVLPNETAAGRAANRRVEVAIDL